MRLDCFKKTRYAGYATRDQIVVSLKLFAVQQLRDILLCIEDHTLHEEITAAIILDGKTKRSLHPEDLSICIERIDGTQILKDSLGFVWKRPFF